MKCYLFCIIAAKCCTFFSIPAIIFLVIMGMIINSQPLYVLGVTDPKLSADGCNNAGMMCLLHIILFLSILVLAIMYAVTFIVSLAYWCFYNNKNGLPLPVNIPFVSNPRNNQPLAQTNQVAYNIVHNEN